MNRDLLFGIVSIIVLCSFNYNRFEHFLTTTFMDLPQTSQRYVQVPMCSNLGPHVHHLCSYSPLSKLALILIPKSGSSTGRHHFKHDLGGMDIPCSKVPKNTTIIATVRDPYRRFLSSYDEMFVRHLGRPQSIPVQFRRFAVRFRNITYPEYEALFNSPKLDQAFEDFVEDYDGVTPFDVHLSSQYDAVRMYQIQRYGPIAEMFPNVELIKGRAYSRRFTPRPHLNEKICTKFLKREYCCLGIDIPDPCKKYIQC